jgi:hypothetical protein
LLSGLSGRASAYGWLPSWTKLPAWMQASNKQDMLIQIIEAFQRLDQLTYGLWEECEGLIAEARLQAQPFATKCIKCQAASEANRPRSQGFRKSMVQTVELEPA